MDLLLNPISLLVRVLGSVGLTLHYVSANLEMPGNWTAPIAGLVKLAVKDSRGLIKFHVNGEFSWKHEPSDSATPQEIWNMNFTTKDRKNTMELKDGGAQVYWNKRKKTSKPTAEYQLGPEYVNLYEWFARLIKDKQSYVDSTTPRIIRMIQFRGTSRSCNNYDIHKKCGSRN